ncbi:Solute carrier family 43 member 3 [Larimichthys crocea]|uniref:Uncharacterized protein n=1 Tax=Larimichthys crocea TaxID=215358 RepID=A0ACD3RVZ4_LARCR|nr:Solute carrier family 43 member 3 [Larimichthys crocea]
MFAFQGGRNKLRHWLTLLSGLVESLFFTGLAFGWASLVFVLKIDGYFAGHCANTTREEDYAVHIDCQDEHFPLVMSVASIANTIIRFPIGYVFDSCGTTVTRLIAIFLYTTGTLFISLSNTATSVLLYPAMSCLITSGTILHLTNVQVGNLFDNYRSTVINIYNGAYDSSAAVFLIIKLLHERGVSLHSSFFFLTSCSVIHFLRTFFLMPRGHIPYPLPETFTYGIGCPGQSRGKGEGENKMKEVDVKKDQKQKRADDETPASHLLQKTLQEPKQEQATFQSCVMSWLFLWHLVWVVTILFCQVIFLSTVNPMLTRLANNDQTWVSESLHQCICLHPAVWSAGCSHKWAHHGQIQAQASGSRRDQARSRPAFILSCSLPDFSAVFSLLCVFHLSCAASAVPHLHLAGCQQRLLLWRPPSLRQHCLPNVSFWEDVRGGDVFISSGAASPVTNPSLHPAPAPR